RWIVRDLVSLLISRTYPSAANPLTPRPRVPGTAADSLLSIIVRRLVPRSGIPSPRALISLTGGRGLRPAPRFGFGRRPRLRPRPGPSRHRAGDRPRGSRAPRPRRAGPVKGRLGAGVRVASLGLLRTWTILPGRIRFVRRNAL